MLKAFFNVSKTSRGNKWGLIDQVIDCIENLTQTPTTRRKLVAIVILPITEIIGIGDTFDKQLRAGKSNRPHMGSFGEECCVLKNDENHREILEGIY